MMEMGSIRAAGNQAVPPTKSRVLGINVVKWGVVGALSCEKRRLGSPLLFERECKVSQALTSRQVRPGPVELLEATCSVESLPLDVGRILSVCSILKRYFLHKWWTS